MNFKKGLIRLFVVCSVLSMIGGFFYTAPDATKNMDFQIQTIWNIDKNLKDPACAEIVKYNPIKFPELTPNYACSPLSIYWEDIKALQAKEPSKYPEINYNLVSATIWEDIRSTQRTIALGGILVGFIWNLFIWILFLICLFTYKWVRKGFKS